MFENMSEFVGYAMHDDLMLRTKTDARVAEAMAMRKAHPIRTRTRSYRARVAQALIALATRIAPPVQQPARTTSATATH